MKNREIEAGAKAIAGDQMFLGGRRKKLSRLVEDHLAWFDAAEARGMTWEDMTAALFAAGVTRPDGHPLSVGTLSSAVWRKRNQMTPARRGNRAAGARRQPPAKEPPPSRAKTHPSDAKRKSGKEGRPALPSGRVGQPVDEARPQGTGVLAFMHRAARMRRLDDD